MLRLELGLRFAWEEEGGFSTILVIQPVGEIDNEANSAQLSWSWG